MSRKPDDVSTRSFSWGQIKWLISPDLDDEAKVTTGEVIIQPGQGHAPHNHPGSEEVLYVISGEGVQTVGEGAEPFTIREGDAVYVPAGVVHSTYNTTWRPLRLLAVYNPGGPEHVLDTLPDAKILGPGVAPLWSQAN
ncbi:cupin domain-containing protein [Streptomyces pathocidini]|uniref:Cupin domain-containing protein n=1 Tax=Streptomyces pathocidini TaxID=1650571 RepID=A0ABW7UNL2_9ACTN|nr:cupin domain-containing protein [Streptomyces pathocidini]